ncbi:Cation/H+ exchanger [Akanthomyces lecanii RCEF 1005]|uniref:Cation/H+ exchanger n=1 Tax=Akanthomyces lecanii RCEF 1005 TaxID=1081108 RepID=A0A168G2P1_CORDF|nr:Cation/H+ exchanger [Akanthomyces lecanii RCEF 1005]
MPSTRLASTPYHEPEIAIILIQSSFLLLLNVINFLLDKAVYCGLLGQVFIGVAWGTPGANWLGTHAEQIIVQLGYLGLLLLVYEGGLSTSLPALKANISLSLGVAATGICLPIGLSFILQYIFDATPLQCFAAGAALCSTSLGTTFTVLSTSGLVQSRLGVVLSSAAMMDDVIGLVMVQIISNLGQHSSSFDAIVVVRPLLVSLGFAVVAPVICILGALPATKWLNARREKCPRGYLNRWLLSRHAPFILHTLVLLGYVTAASYAGTSNLFTAYIAGSSISWWDTQVPHAQFPDEQASNNTASAAADPISTDGSPVDASGLATYESIYSVAVNRVLRPFFFASIGFSIPITEMFAGEIVWKGLVYTVLMMLGKLLCGVWLLRLPEKLKRLKRTPFKKDGKELSVEKRKTPAKAVAESDTSATAATGRASHASGHDGSNTSQALSRSNKIKRTNKNAAPSGVKPRSIYPASILGCAMMARGEIGFLISSIAESEGIFTNGSDTGSNSKLFLCVTWAIVLCTIIGPLSVGLLVQRIKKLQRHVEKAGGQVHGGVLGAWGI